MGCKATLVVERWGEPPKREGKTHGSLQGYLEYGPFGWVCKAKPKGKGGRALTVGRKATISWVGKPAWGVNPRQLSQRNDAVVGCKATTVPSNDSREMSRGERGATPTKPAGIHQLPPGLTFQRSCCHSYLCPLQRGSSFTKYRCKGRNQIQKLDLKSTRNCL